MSKAVHMTGASDPFPIAIIVSLFNQEVTQALLDGAVGRLEACGFTSQDISIIKVPGAVEIPYVAQQLAKTNKYPVIITLGAVIRGETSHYDVVCQVVSSGCQQVSLTYDIPIIFGVLTTENSEQAWDRLGGQHGHKGVDAANCAMEMYRVRQALSQL